MLVVLPMALYTMLPLQQQQQQQAEEHQHLQGHSAGHPALQAALLQCQKSDASAWRVQGLLQKTICASQTTSTQI
jgi:hypothetical protein